MKKVSRLKFGTGLLVVLGLLASVPSNSQVPPAGPFDCSLPTACIYHAQKNLPSNIIDAVNKTVLGGIPLLGTGKGLLEAPVGSVQTILFYHTDPNVLQAMKDAILKFDSDEGLIGRELVVVRADIYEADDRIGHDYDVYVNNVTQTPGILTPANAPAVTNPRTGNLVSGLSVATNFFSGFLRAEKDSGVIKKTSFAQIAITNNQTFNYSFKQPVYTYFVNSNIVKENDLGLGLSGTVDISGSDPNIILLQNPSISYGPEAGNATQIVPTLSISTPELYLLNGQSTIYVGLGVKSMNKSSGIGLRLMGHQEESVQKILIALQADSMTLADYAKKAKNATSEAAPNTLLTQTQISKLPATGPSVEDIISSIKPIATITPSGDRVMSFILDPEQKLLSQATYNTNVNIQIKGPKFKDQNGQKGQGGVRRLQSLVMNQFQIDELPFDQVKKDSLYPLCVGFGKAENEKDLKAKPFKVIHLDLNTQTNEFYVSNGKCDF